MNEIRIATINLDEVEAVLNTGNDCRNENQHTLFDNILVTTGVSYYNWLAVGTYSVTVFTVVV